MNPRELKTALRQQVRARLGFSPEQRAIASAAACARLAAQEVWRRARAVLVYYPMADELDLWALASSALDKVILLPRYVAAEAAYSAFRVQPDGANLIPGRFGILEPAPNSEPWPANQLDLVLVPGVAFDSTGTRLGRGRGFYDRLLAATNGLKCGVGWDEQVLPELPLEPHDIRLNCILTPAQWLVCQTPPVLK